MKTYLCAFNLWDVVENEKEPPHLVWPKENYSEEKAKSCIESSVSDEMFIKIMTCEIAKQAWDVLKEEFIGNDKTR